MWKNRPGQKKNSRFKIPDFKFKTSMWRFSKSEILKSEILSQRFQSESFKFEILKAQIFNQRLSGLRFQAIDFLASQWEIKTTCETPNLELLFSINLKIQSLRGTRFCELIDHGNLQHVGAWGQAG